MAAKILPGAVALEVIGLYPAELQGTPSVLYGQSPERWEFFDITDPTLRYHIGNDGLFHQTGSAGAPPVVASVAAVAALGVGAPASIQVPSFYGDGGTVPRQYQRDDNDMTTPANGATVVFDSVGNRFKAPRDQILSGRYAGALVNGVADDSPAYQKMLDEAASRGGQNVYVDIGRSRLQTGLILESGVSLIGYADAANRPQGSFLQALPGLVGPMVLQPSDPTNIRGHSGVRGIKFQGVSTQGATPPFSQGVVLLGQNSWVRNCYFLLFNDQAIQIGEFGTTVSVGSQVSDCYVTSAMQNRTRSRISGALEVYGTDHYLMHNQVGCGYSGYPTPFPPPVDAVNKWVAGFALLGANCFVNATHGEASDVGIRIAGTGGYNRLVNCRGDYVSCDGWIIDNSLNMITNGMSQSMGQTAAGHNQYDGFVISATAFGNRLVNCLDRQTKSNKSRYSFNDFVNSNDIRSRTQYLACSGDGVTSVFNTVDFSGSCPSEPAVRFRPTAGTVVPDTTGTTVLDFGFYTMPTTVTGFLGGYSGKTLVILGKAGVTLQYNPASILPKLRGGATTRADLPLADLTVYQFTNFNGLWIENE